MALIIAFCNTTTGTTKSFITTKTAWHSTSTSETYGTCITISITSQASCTTCATPSTAIIAITSTTANTAITIRRTAIATIILKNISVNDFLFLEYVLELLIIWMASSITSSARLTTIATCTSGTSCAVCAICATVTCSAAFTTCTSCTMLTA